MKKDSRGQPRRIFNNFSAIAVIIGIVVGIGIFRLPSMVAQNAASELHYLSFWIAGGIISIIGALCYAELASASPMREGNTFSLPRHLVRELVFFFRGDG